jgi:predicted MPP superfamily phosphohydrolase
MKFAWLTDIHLNFIEDVSRQKFYQEIVNTECDGVLMSGDIAEAPNLIDILNEMARYINKPIYFVLGNHDYYRGQISEVHDAMTALTKEHDKLFWLPAAGMQKLDNNTFLIGQDGWADGRLGDYQNSRVVLNDSRMIADLFQEKMLGKYQLLEKMQQLADADAKRLQNDLEQASNQNPKKIIVLTHVPPFKEACLHKGEISNNDWLPYFCSQIMGKTLAKAAQENSKIEFLVLCGHTHSEASYHCFNNLVVKVGRAEYYRPEVQEIILV